MLTQQFLDMLTRFQTYRAQNLNIYVEFDVESESEVEHTELLRVEPKI